MKSKIITERNLLLLLVSLLLIASLIDIYTAFTSPIFEIAEMNPIYVLTGSKGPLIIVSILVTVWIIKSIYSSISIFKIFLFTLMTIYLIFAHSVGIYMNNLATEQYYENPEEVIKQTSEYKPKDKFINYSILMGLVMMIPVIFSMIAFHVTMVFYNSRKPKREKIIDDVYKLTHKLRYK